MLPDDLSLEEQERLRQKAREQAQLRLDWLIWLLLSLLAMVLCLPAA